MTCCDYTLFIIVSPCRVVCVILTSPPYCAPLANNAFTIAFFFLLIVGDVDIIDEAIDFFRANVLHRNFQSEGPADLTLAYLTVYIGEVLRVFAKQDNKKDATKNIVQVSMSGNFAIPGSNSFPLSGFFEPPKNRSESGMFVCLFSIYRVLSSPIARFFLPLLYVPLRSREP